MSLLYKSSGAPFSFLPTGSIILWAGSESSIPKGWLLCDGGVVKQKTYPKLFGVVSSYYNTGAEAADEFRVPSLNNRYVRGGTPNTVTYSGSNTHSHSFTTAWGVAASSSDGAHTHAISALLTSNAGSQDTHTHTPTGQNTNSGVSDNNSSVQATGTAVTVSIANHGHNFGVTSIGNNTANHTHTTSNTSNITAGGHNHAANVTNATATTVESNNTEQSYFKARALIKT